MRVILNAAGMDIHSLQHSAIRTVESGSSLVEMALLMPLLVLMLVTAVDLGRAYFLVIEVSSSAEAGALYGSQNPTDTAGMVLASGLDAPEVSGIASVATYGCECFDGTAPVASCSSVPACVPSTGYIVNYVEVDTSATYIPIMIYPGVPSSIGLTGKARMRTGY